MAQIPNLGQFNSNKELLLKIRTAKDETILCTKNELKDALITYIDEELDFMATSISSTRLKALEERIMERIDEFEIGLNTHIINKINSVTERIVEATLNRKIDEEVNKRLNNHAGYKDKIR